MVTLLADNQDITRAGLMFLCERMDGTEYRQIYDKATLIEQLCLHTDAVVILDYTLLTSVSRSSIGSSSAST